MEHLAPHWQGGLPSMRAPRSRGAAPEEDRRGRAAGHAPRRDARVLGPDRARPCAGSEAEAAPLPRGPPRSQPWSRARGGPPRLGGRARAAPGCTGAGARPRPPLRRIRGRGRALARRQSSSLLVPTRRPSGPACARAGWRGRTLLTSVHMQSLGSPSRFGLPPPKLPVFSPLPVAPRDASRDSRVRPPDVYKLVLQMPLPPIVIHPLPSPRTTFLGRHQGASAGERAGGSCGPWRSTSRPVQPLLTVSARCSSSSHLVQGGHNDEPSVARYVYAWSQGVNHGARVSSMVLVILNSSYNTLQSSKLYFTCMSLAGMLLHSQSKGDDGGFAFIAEQWEPSVGDRLLEPLFEFKLLICVKLTAH
uniref:Uncharacterized protein n=1 Tax=Zea mays TaxID=4577 RepID=A0A804PBF9_MAIZE